MDLTMGERGDRPERKRGEEEARNLEVRGSEVRLEEEDRGRRYFYCRFFSFKKRKTSLPLSLFLSLSLPLSLSLTRQQAPDILQLRIVAHLEHLEQLRVGVGGRGRGGRVERAGEGARNDEETGRRGRER